MNTGHDTPGALPSVGLSKEAVLDQLSEMRNEDTDWRAGKSGLHVYWAGDDVQQIAARAYAMFMNSNALAPRAFPSLRQMEEQIIKMSLPLWNAPPDAAAALTSGGTESIVLAMQAIRHWSRETRPNLERPAVLAGTSAHPAYEKAAAILDMTVIRVPLGSDYRIDVQALADRLSDQVVAIIGSAPCLPFGTVDPIIDLGECAQNNGLWLHVDACLGGYLAPFVQRLGLPVPDHDFRVPGVRSLSADIHKYGYAPKGNSVIAYRHDGDLARNRFAFRDWPKGAYATTTLSGTRSGGNLAAAWAVMMYLGEAGYRKCAARVMGTRARLEAGLSALGPFDFLGPQPLGVVSFACGGYDHVFEEDRLANLGWYTSRIANPVGLHMTLTPVHEQSVDRLLEDLAQVMVAPRGRYKPVEIATY